MKEPAVSIVIPVYNVEEYLDRCVQSVLRQTLKDIEIILVDDGSPDRCPQMCDEYASKYSHIKVVHKKNAGLGMACNSGLDVATGKYVAFLDSDDWVDPEMYETMYDTAEKHEAQLVFSGLRRVDESGNIYPMSIIKEIQVYSSPEMIEEFRSGMVASAPSERLERRIPMSAKVVLYDREFIERNGIRFESERHLISEDLIFNLDNLWHTTCVVVLPDMFYNYFTNEKSLTNAVRLDRFDKEIILREELHKRYPKASAEFHTRVDRLFIGYMRSDVCHICQAESLSFKEKRAAVKRVSSFPVWNDICKTYPVKSMPFVHRLFFKGMVSGWFVLLYMLANLKR